MLKKTLHRRRNNRRPVRLQPVGPGIKKGFNLGTKTPFEYGISPGALAALRTRIFHVTYGASSPKKKNSKLFMHPVSGHIRDRERLLLVVDSKRRL